MKSKNKKCPFCDKLISTTSHLKKCNPKITEKESYNLMVEKTYDCEVQEIINFYLSGSSLPDIKENFGLPYTVTKKILNINGFNTRTIKQSSNELRYSKYKKTVNDKYGVDNISELDFIKEKKSKTFYENYGVDNIFKLNGFGDYVTKLCIERYGVKRKVNPELISKKRKEFSPEKWEEIHKKTRLTYQKRFENGAPIEQFKSKLEKLVYDSFIELSIDVKEQRYVNGRSYDFQITNTNLLIEINGDYWHANPKFYSSGEFINYKGDNKLVDDIWERDKIKHRNALEYGYKVIYLWEWEINDYFSNNNLNNLILDKLWEVKIE